MINDGAAMNIQSLPHGARTELLARLAHTLTICARDTYEVGTENVVEPRVLRAYNELLHRVAGSVVDHLLGKAGYSLESILEMTRQFGTKHNRAGEIDSALNRVLNQTGKA
jgi:hypothetical protein